MFSFFIAAPIIKRGLSHNITKIAGAQVKFTCIGESIPAPHVQWLKNNKTINNAVLQTSGNFERTSQLTISDVMYKDSGEYTCVFTNYRGRFSSRARLVVNGGYFTTLNIPCACACVCEKGRR